MESATFRKWLSEKGCRFDRHERQERGEGQVMVTVHREGRTSQAPVHGSRSRSARLRRVCEEVGLDWSKLPGRKPGVMRAQVRLILSTLAKWPNCYERIS